MRTFSIEELRERPGELGTEALEGRLSLVTQNGLPLFVSVPFTKALLQAGVHTALAVHLFKSGDLTLGRASKLAGMTLPQFLECVSARDIALVTHDPSELERELAAFDDHGKVRLGPSDEARP